MSGTLLDEMLLNDMYFNISFKCRNMCQLFITANIVVYLKNSNVWIYYKKSLHELRQNYDKNNAFEIQAALVCMCMYLCANPKSHLKNMHNYITHKLNYTRVYKNVMYRKYINYSNVITIIVDRLFSNT